MGVAAAVVGAGALAATGAVVGASMSSSAAKSAANTQAQAAEQSAAIQQQEVAQAREDLTPFREAGNTGLQSLLSSLGLGGGGPNLLAANGINGLTFQPTQAQLEATPGYQFDLAQGLQGVANSNAAQGRGISGAALKGAASYATGLANNTLATQQGIFQQNLANVLSPLSSIASLGENAAATSGNQGIQGTQAIGNTLVGGANASAAGTVGSANALSSGLGSLGSLPTNYLLYNNLLSGGGVNSGGVDTASSFGSGGLGDSAF